MYIALLTYTDFVSLSRRLYLLCRSKCHGDYQGRGFLNAFGPFIVLVGPYTDSRLEYAYRIGGSRISNRAALGLVSVEKWCILLVYFGPLRVALHSGAVGWETYMVPRKTFHMGDCYGVACPVFLQMCLNLIMCG